MKYDLLTNHNEYRKGEKLFYKNNSNMLNIDLFQNKLLNNAIESSLIKKVYKSIDNKQNNQQFLLKKPKIPSSSSSYNINKRINSAFMELNLSPRNNCSPIEKHTKKQFKLLSNNHKNFYAINISDNSYNFHKNEQSKTAKKDKKSFVYFNKNKDKTDEKNEEEKCNINKKNPDVEEENQENIEKNSGFRTSYNFSHSKKKQTLKLLQEFNLQETPINSNAQESIQNKEDKGTQVIMYQSKSIQNTSRRSKPWLDNKKIEIETIIPLIKENVKNYFIKHRFSSVKDYFNDWLYYKRKKDYQKKIFLDEDSIYYYLKEKIGVKIFRDDVNKIFKCRKNLFDIDMFKNFFFEENSGKKPLYINESFLLKTNLFNSYNKFNKHKNYLLSFSDIIKSTKNNFPNFKNNLLISALKENKSKIVDEITNNLVENNKKCEYDYLEFYNLFQNLNIDKRLINKKMIKKMFNKYKNENDKINIKYFFNNIYKNNSIKNSLFSEKEENQKNTSNSTNHVSNNNYYNSNPINLHLNKIEFKTKNKSKNKSFIKTIEKNKNMKDFAQQSPIREIERYNHKYKVSYNKNEINNNKCNNYINKNQFTKLNELKLKKLRRKKYFISNDSSFKNSNINNVFKTNKKKYLKLNNYKTIQIRKQYQSNTINDMTTKYNNNKNKKLDILDRPISAFSRSLLGINNKNRNYSCFMNNETLKILSEDSRVTKLNSDIINLI